MGPNTEFPRDGFGGARMEEGRFGRNGVTERPYHQRLTRIRDAFPAPVSDRKHDAYFVFSILRALDEVDDLKSEVPLLGRPRSLDYATAEQAELTEEGRSVEDVAHMLVGQLEGMPIWGHPRTQINVVPHRPSRASSGRCCPPSTTRTWCPTTRRTASC